MLDIKKLEQMGMEQGFSHVALLDCDTIELNRVDRWVMVTVHTFGANEGDLLEFLAALEAAR